MSERKISAREQSLEGMFALPDVSSFYPFTRDGKMPDLRPAEVAEIQFTNGGSEIAFVAGTYRKRVVYSCELNEEMLIPRTNIQEAPFDAIAGYIKKGSP